MSLQLFTGVLLLLPVCSGVGVPKYLRCYGAQLVPTVGGGDPVKVSVWDEVQVPVPILGRPPFSFG